MVVKITHEEYTLDLSQSEVFLVYSWKYWIFFFGVILCFV